MSGSVINSTSIFNAAIADPYDTQYFVCGLYPAYLVFPGQFIERWLVTSFPVATLLDIKFLMLIIFNVDLG
jgi:hypothetical protein